MANKAENRGRVGRRVSWTGGRGEWIVRAVVGARLRIWRGYGTLTFVVARDTVKFLRGNYTVPAASGDVVVRSKAGL